MQGLRERRGGSGADVTLSWKVGFLEEVTPEPSVQGGVGVGQMERRWCRQRQRGRNQVLNVRTQQQEFTLLEWEPPAGRWGRGREGPGLRCERPQAAGAGGLAVCTRSAASTDRIHVQEGAGAAAPPPRARQATRAWARQRASGEGQRFENDFSRQMQRPEVGEVAWPSRGRLSPPQSWGEQLRFPTSARSAHAAACLEGGPSFCWCPLAAQPGRVSGCLPVASLS